MRRSPSAVTSSTAATDDESGRLPSPEPCVPVATAPATEMCGSDGRFGSANPAASRTGAISPYRRPAATSACPASAATSTRGGRPGHRDQVAGGVGDAVERVPRTQRPHLGRAGDDLLELATEVGSCSRAAPNVTLPAQFFMIAMLRSTTVASGSPAYEPTSTRT